MRNHRSIRNEVLGILSMTALAMICGTATAQSVQGVINGRSGSTMTLETQDAGNVVVALTPDTQVEEVQGLLKARSKQMAVTALIPGLPVQVQGSSYNALNQLVADTVKFKGNSLQAAEDTQAGLAPTEAQVQANQQQLQAEQQIVQQQQQQLQAEQQKSAANAAAIAANKAAIAEDNKRFGELADYNILGEVTVLFGNGQVTIDPERKLSAVSPASSGSTPKTLVRGLSCLTAAATPESSPPPLTGASTRSTSGKSSMISRPQVAWPVMMSSSS